MMRLLKICHSNVNTFRCRQNDRASILATTLTVWWTSAVDDGQQIQFFETGRREVTETCRSAQITTLFNAGLTAQLDPKSSISILLKTYLKPGMSRV